jgi:hypothetical protein
VQGICAREKLPGFDRLWIDCIQEETWLESRNGMQKSNNDENQALAARTRKSRGGGSPEREASPEPRRKKDLSKVKCFACHDYGHYASQCPLRRKGGRRQHASTTEVDEVADRLQREFLLVSTLSGTVSCDGAWLVDSGASCHMTGARELFESITETDSDMCVELGMGTRHAVQGTGTVRFQLESGEMLRVTNVLWVPELRRSVLSVSEIEKKGYHILFWDGQVLFVPRGSSFRSTVVLGVRERNLYRLKGQPIRAIASSSRLTEDREQIAPQAMQVQREQVALEVVQTQRESDFRGSQPSGFSGEEQPPKIVKKKSDFRGSMQTQREPDLRGSQWAQRESQPFRGSSPSGSGGREASSKTDRKVSWVEEARQEAQKREASRSCMSSQEDPCLFNRSCFVTEEATNQEDWRAGFASVTEGATSQEDWSAVVVADPVQETELLPVWETEVHPDVGGWNTSLAKREC